MTAFVSGQEPDHRCEFLWMLGEEGLGLDRCSAHSNSPPYSNLGFKGVYATAGGELVGCGAGVGFSPTSPERPVMRRTRQLSITLPIEMADMLRERVRSGGEYASESELIREGLRALFARDQAVEAWLRDEVAAAYDAVAADPSRAVSAQSVRARLEAEQAGSM